MFKERITHSMMPIGIKEKIRDLSYVEEFFFWRTHLGHYTNYRILGEYDVESVTANSLSYALSTMLNKFSALTMNLKPVTIESPTGFGYHLVDKVFLSDVVDFIELSEETCNPEFILNNFTHERFYYGNNKPLWKLKVFNYKYILFYCDHLLYDGTSGKNFHIELSKSLLDFQTVRSEESCDLNSVVFDKSTIDFGKYQVIPDPTKVINYTPPVLTTIYELIMALAPKPIRRFLYYWTSGNPYVKQMSLNNLSYKECKLFPDETSTVKIIHLESAKVKSLIKIARDHDVKLSSLLIILANLSFSQFIKNEGQDSKYSIPVDIRFKVDDKKGGELCPNFSKLFGLYVGCVVIEMPEISKLCPDGKLDWDIVKYVNDQIHDNREASAYVVSLLRFVNRKKFLQEKVEEKDLATFELSNLGVVDNNKTLSQLWFDQPPELFSCNVISTKTGGINLTLRCVNEQWVNAYFETMKNYIDSMLEA